jgi:hypothetical protein
VSLELINRSPDLSKLREEGYEVEVKSSYLIVGSVPYLDSKGMVREGSLVSELTLAGDKTAKPSTHVVYFAGDYPCQTDGSPIVQIGHSTSDQTLAEGITVNHSFSSRPNDGYVDYHHKMSTYAAIVSAPAQSVDPGVTARTFRPVESGKDGDVFNYVDTFSSKAGIAAVSAKLRGYRIAIVGLGGTGAYILDFLAKTPVAQIHLFDGDDFLQHNAFRAPGAASVEELASRPLKARFWAETYSRMRRGIIAHNDYISADNLDQLRDFTFVFLCIDKGSAKEPIIAKLEEWETAFIDVGMGVELVDGSLTGVLRVTTSTINAREHVRDKGRIDFSDGGDDDAYDQNIQIAELNALNAALAVVKWKKLCGFYHDLQNENHSTWTIETNVMASSDAP